MSLGRSEFSEDGSLFAYQLSSGGSDWVTINLMRVDAATGKPTKLDEVLRDVKFSGIAWTHDNKVRAAGCMCCTGLSESAGCSAHTVPGKQSIGCWTERAMLCVAGFLLLALPPPREQWRPGH